MYKTQELKNQNFKNDPRHPNRWAQEIHNKNDYCWLTKGLSQRRWPEEKGYGKCH